MKTPTPEWLVERLHAGDLSPEEAEAVRARLAAEGGSGRLDELRRDDAASRIAHPAAPALEEIRRRAGVRPPRPRRAHLLLAPALTAVAAAALVLALPHRTGRELGAEDGPEVTREKGLDARLQVYRQDQPDPLRSGDVARAGDVLQLAYVSAGAAYGAVVSVDGRGGVTLHWPEGGGSAAALRAGGAVPLAHAYQLDDAPRFERFFLVTGERPFQAGVVVEAARKLAASGRAESGVLVLPGGLEQKAFTIRKP